MGSRGRTLRGFIRSWLLLLACAPTHAGGVAILSTVLEDNGDHDGFADSRETVQLRLLVQNTSGTPLSGVTLGLQPVGPGRACVTDGTLVVGDLAIDEVRLTAGAFELVVGDLDRTGLGLGSLAPFEQALVLTVPAHPTLAIHPSEIALDLDLNVSGGAGPTTWFESFEDGFGTFEIENLDEPLNQPEIGIPEDPVDGWRCQYYDPANPNNNNAGVPPDDSNGSNHCHPGINLAHAEQVFWNLSGPAFSPLGGRGFSGFNSLFFGFDLGPPLEFSTPMATIEAVRTSEPIHLGWNDAPTLSIKHQVSLVDESVAGFPTGKTVDRGVVLVQLADDASDPVGPWIKLHPSTNVYDAQVADNYYGCMFDPPDDGNDEDDFFNPFDPERRFGPSSTCAPAYTFARLGETSEPFDAANLGRADGPGLQGMWGIGTWVESSFDLSRFRGRSIRLRFLASAFRTAFFENWNEYFGEPLSGDDGWWIDDVTITSSLTTPATVSNDDADNSGLPILSDGDLDGVFDVCDNCVSGVNANQADADADGTGDACDTCPGEAFVVDHDLDGLCAIDNCPYVVNLDQINADGDPAGQACDCNDGNPTTHPGAAEINDGIDQNCAGDLGFGSTDEISGLAGFLTAGNDDLFSWPAQAGAVRYQVARAASPEFTAGCAASLVSQATYLDTTPVPAGTVRYYLVRARLPNAGSWGTDSAGTQRVVPCAS
jgi:hypothetical protein